MEEAPPLIQHMEVLFGRIQAGFSLPEDVTPTPGIQYAKYREGTVSNGAVISTVGLSRFELASSTSNKTTWPFSSGTFDPVSLMLGIVRLSGIPVLCWAFF
jgi:hypothetical protein